MLPSECGKFRPARHNSEPIPISWAQMDLNHRPHPYQGCALTGLSYEPQSKAESV